MDPMCLCWKKASEAFFMMVQMLVLYGTSALSVSSLVCETRSRDWSYWPFVYSKCDVNTSNSKFIDAVCMTTVARGIGPFLPKTNCWLEWQCINSSNNQIAHFVDPATPEMWWSGASPIGLHTWGNIKMIKPDCTNGTLNRGVRETTVKPPWTPFVWREPPFFGVNHVNPKIQLFPRSLIVVNYAICNVCMLSLNNCANVTICFEFWLQTLGVWVRSRCRYRISQNGRTWQCVWSAR